MSKREMVKVDPVLKSILAVPNGGVEAMAEALGKLHCAKQRLREWQELLELEMVDYISRNGEIVIGEVRYYVGHPSKTTCHDVAGLLFYMLRAGYGAERIALYLRSQPFKHGAIRSEDQAAFDTFFKVERVEKLEEGKPRKQLIASSTKYGNDRAGIATTEAEEDE